LQPDTETSNTPCSALRASSKHDFLHIDIWT
jgi:hypothetical protein